MIFNTLEFPDRTVIYSPQRNESFPLKSLNFSGQANNFTRLDPDYFENKVWLVMKIIFEKKELSISKLGSIQKLNKGEPIELKAFKGQIARITCIFRQREYAIIQTGLPSGK